MFGNDFSHVLEGVQSKSAISSNSPNEGREEGVCESSIRTDLWYIFKRSVSF